MIQDACVDAYDGWPRLSMERNTFEERGALWVAMTLLLRVTGDV